jgi:hypothetical protein
MLSVKAQKKDDHWFLVWENERAKQGATITIPVDGSALSIEKALRAGLQSISESLASTWETKSTSRKVGRKVVREDVGDGDE